jgi:hypothetical protein
MFDTFAAVMMVIIFLVPGYIWYVVQGKFVYLDRRLEWQKFALGLVTRSTFIYLPIAAVIYKAWTEKAYETRPGTVGFAAVLLILCLPAAVGYLLGRMGQTRLLYRILAWCQMRVFAEDIPTAWDAVFSDDLRNCWAIVTLKNGREVRGLIGENTWFSSDPGDRDLYLFPVLKPDSEVEGYVRGVYIKAEEISTIDLFRPKRFHEKKPDKN